MEATRLPRGNTAGAMVDILTYTNRRELVRDYPIELSVLAG